MENIWKIQQRFIVHCQTGNLDLAQDLLQKNPNINISAMNESAFRYACAHGHLSVAQWLIEVKPDIDISMHNDDAFSICL